MDHKYILEKYSEVRYANRGLFFKKRKQIDLRTIEDVKEYFTSKHMEGVVIEKDGEEALMIFGSNQLIDWFFNLSFRFKETPYPSVTKDEIKVHKGFYRSYLTIRDYIRQRFSETEKLVVYGQSLGAAVATFAMLDLKYNYPSIEIDPVSTGSPRVGNESFRQSFNKYISGYRRYVCGSDLVTSVPPKSFGFIHVVEEIHLGKRRRFPSIKDHMIKRYIETISDQT